MMNIPPVFNDLLMGTFMAPAKGEIPPSSSVKRRFRLGFPTKNVIVLMVTVTGWGVDPNHSFITKASR